MTFVEQRERLIDRLNRAKPHSVAAVKLLLRIEAVTIAMLADELAGG